MHSIILQGGGAIGIPSEVGSHYEAWKLWGKLPWADLFAPSISIAESGFKVDSFLGYAIQSTEKSFFDSNTMAKHPWLQNLK